MPTELLLRADAYPEAASARAVAVHEHAIKPGRSIAQIGAIRVLPIFSESGRKKRPGNALAP
jgi:hypothetical protein